MTFDVVFSESNQEFDVVFNEVQNISDGGYERGYAAGYLIGNTEGYATGYGAGHTNGIAIGAGDIASGAFAGRLDTSINKIRQYGFMDCSELTEINAPNVTTIGRNAFSFCGRLKRAIFPKLTTGGNDMFSYCYLLEYIDLGNIAALGSWVFTSCRSLAAVVLRKNSVVNLTVENAFSSSGVQKGTGFVYVPDNLVEQYKVATNWQTYASQIRPLSELEG